MNIYVGNLDYKVNEYDLEQLFNTFGSVSEAKVIMDKYSGRSKGFGFVTMDDEGEARKAVEGLNGTSFKNRDLVVNEARPQKSRY
ncbi:RNA recognition motif domain-containing protein [Saccharicrinis sp. FJH54]|uniref:RNA recognition motif domain-containing protein n=1 Tax=Saccharicrinis sp. FJH54 TaxID=3344665 RepID=UPI0035D52550